MKNLQENSSLKRIQNIFVKYFLLTVLIFVGISCQTQQTQKANNSAEIKVDAMTNSLVNQNSEEKDTKSLENTESVVDYLKIGIPRKNKIELNFYGGSNENFVEVKFYSLNKVNKWQLKQNLKITKYGGLELDMQIKDFNKDGFNDVTFVSGIAARGANEIRELLIYDRKTDQLIHIKNSSDYPNLLYNKWLDCLDSQIFTGSTSTVFLKIEGDKLREFALIENFDAMKERRVYLIDKTGNRKLFRRDKISEDDIYERYKTFNPPKVYTAKNLKQ